jgi:hypothetical protein
VGCVLCIWSWWGNCKKRDRWGDLDVYALIILGFIFGENSVYRFQVGKP